MSLAPSGPEEVGEGEETNVLSLDEPQRGVAFLQRPTSKEEAPIKGYDIAMV
jgi:hypothetical protein